MAPMSGLDLRTKSPLLGPKKGFYSVKNDNMEFVQSSLCCAVVRDIIVYAVVAAVVVAFVQDFRTGLTLAHTRWSKVKWGPLFATQKKHPTMLKVYKTP